MGPDDNIQGTHRDHRPKEEIERWRKKDPINKFEGFLINHRILKGEHLKAIKQEVKREVKAAHMYAKMSPYPNPKELVKYVFKE